MKNSLGAAVLLSAAAMADGCAGPGSRQQLSYFDMPVRGEEMAPVFVGSLSGEDECHEAGALPVTYIARSVEKSCQELITSHGRPCDIKMVEERTSEKILFTVKCVNGVNGSYFPAAVAACIRREIEKFNIERSVLRCVPAGIITSDLPRPSSVSEKAILWQEGK